MEKRYTQLHVLTLWNGSGSGHHFSVIVNDEFKKLITSHIEEAIRVKQERQRDSSRRSVIKSLTERGLPLVEQLSGYDENDLTGLIGEILTDDFIINLSLEPVFQKWRCSGTTKSPGIDLVARQRIGEAWELVLYEAKHLHNEIRSRAVELCHDLIRHKFKIGIDEFEYEKTRINLADILMKLGTHIRIGEASGSDVGLAKEHRNFIQSSLQNDSYRLSVVVLVDSKYCNNETFSRSVSEIPNPLEQGENHSITLNLVEPRHLEEVTDEMRDNYVGAI